MARRWLTAAALLAVVCVAGCNRGGNAYVTQFPRWEYEHYQRLAVLPGRALTPQAARDAGALSERLTTLLTENRTFEILSRSDMEQVMKEQDLSLIAGAIDEGTALPAGQIKIAQALIATKITDYKLISDKQRQSIPVYAYDPRGRVLRDRYGRPMLAGEEVVWVYTSGAEVEGTVHVIDAATGKVLASHTARLRPKPVTARNGPPGQTPEQIASAAARELAVEFYKVIAPTRTRVKLKGDMLVVATAYFDGKYETPKRLPHGLDTFIVAVRELPEQCDRNNFRIAIAAQDGRENLWEEEFVWPGGAGAEGLSFRVPLDKLTTAGGAKFVAKLYSGREPEPILRREFAIEEAK
jgi:hypothetical protein